LTAWIDQLAGRRVLVVGDLMLDRYLWGDTERISPEAPVPVVDAVRESHRLGGAANVAHNVASLGGEPIVVGTLGGDGFGLELRRSLDSGGVSVDRLVQTERRTTCKTRILARNQQILRIDREDRGELSEADRERVWNSIDSALDSVDACVISDYGKGVVSTSLLERLLPEALERGVPVCVDPKEANFFQYQGVATLTPNQLEAGTAFGRRIETTADLAEAGEHLLGRLSARSLLITRGEHGMVLFQSGATPLTFPALARHVFDVTGAGDTVVSTFALALAAGASFPVAAALSNHAAGLVVKEVGTAVPGILALRQSIEGAGPESASADLVI